MPADTLKHYNKYLNKLEKLTTAFGYKLVFVPSENIDSEAIFNPRRKLIQVDEDVEQTIAIASILHELGHLIDDISMGGYEHGVDRAYHNYYNEQATSRQFKVVKGCECRAWKHGEYLAKCLKIDIGKWFYRYRRECLRSYKKG